MQTISAKDSIALIPDGATVMVGGFLAVGTPERAVDEILAQKKRDLTVIANDTALREINMPYLLAKNILLV